jgi:hypothetical protein
MKGGIYNANIIKSNKREKQGIPGKSINGIEKVKRNKGA